MGQASRCLRGSGALGRSSRGLVDNRCSLGRHVLGHDHALAAAVAAGAAAADDLAVLATAAAAAVAGNFAAAAAVAGNLAARAAVSGSNLTVATTVLAEQATPVAPLATATVATLTASVELGQQTATMAAAATVAAVAGYRAAVTADEGDGHQREKHRERETEKTLH